MEKSTSANNVAQRHVRDETDEGVDEDNSNQQQVPAAQTPVVAVNSPPDLPMSLSIDAETFPIGVAVETDTTHDFRGTRLYLPQLGVAKEMASISDEMQRTLDDCLDYLQMDPEKIINLAALNTLSNTNCSLLMTMLNNVSLDDMELNLSLRMAKQGLPVRYFLRLSTAAAVTKWALQPDPISKTRAELEPSGAVHTYFEELIGKCESTLLNYYLMLTLIDDRGVHDKLRHKALRRQAEEQLRDEAHLRHLAAKTSKELIIAIAPFIAAPPVPFTAAAYFDIRLDPTIRPDEQTLRKNPQVQDNTIPSIPLDENDEFHRSEIAVIFKRALKLRLNCEADINCDLKY